VLRLFKYLKPYAPAAVATAALVACQAMAELYLPTLMSDIVNKGITRGDTGYIIHTGGLMLAVAVGGACCAVLAGYLAAQVSMGFGEILRQRMFAHVTALSLHEFDRFSTPSLITRTTNDVTQVQMVTMVGLRMMIMAPIMCVGGIIMAVSKDRDLAWILVVVIPLLAGVIAWVAFKGFPLFRSIQAKLDRITQVMREGLSGVRVIRAFDQIEHQRGRFREANLDLTGTTVRVNRIMAVLMPVMILVMSYTTIAIIWFGSIRVNHGTSNVGDMMAFLQYAMQIMFSMMMAILLFIMLPRGQASAERIAEVLEMAPTIGDPAAPAAPACSVCGHVAFRGVTFAYHGAEEPALRDISFAATPGKVTAIIGSTGSGKSTLISLIPRFYDVGAGTVEVDGVDVRAMAQADLRARIGFVPQKAVLFSGTVADNIRYGKPDATDDEVRHAAATAQATAFIEAMGGFDAVIAEAGANLSGGQKQRLAIARALVRQPEIYVFDDSFSALDFKTDAKLRAALRQEIAHATVLIVAQRVATVLDADQIIVLDEGRIAGIGSHRQLYKDCQLYREIVASQLSEEELR